MNFMEQSNVKGDTLGLVYFPRCKWYIVDGRQFELFS